MVCEWGTNVFILGEINPRWGRYIQVLVIRETRSSWNYLHFILPHLPLQIWSKQSSWTLAVCNFFFPHVERKRSQDLKRICNFEDYYAIIWFLESPGCVWWPSICGSFWSSLSSPSILWWWWWWWRCLLMLMFWSWWCFDHDDVLLMTMFWWLWCLDDDDILTMLMYWSTFNWVTQPQRPPHPCLIFNSSSSPSPSPLSSSSSPSSSSPSSGRQKWLGGSPRSGSPTQGLFLWIQSLPLFLHSNFFHFLGFLFSLSWGWAMFSFLNDAMF